MPNLLLVPLDGSAEAAAAIPHAVEIARRMSAGIALVRVHQPMAMMAGPPELGPMLPDPDVEALVCNDAEAWLLQRADDLRRTSGLLVVTEFRVGSLSESIVDVATELAVLAIVCCTNHASGWAPNWIGSVTDAVVRHAPCPVIAMSAVAAARPPGVQRLLVLTDGSDVAEAVFPYAMWLARTFDAEMEVLHVVAPEWSGDGIALAVEPTQDHFGVSPAAEHAKAALDALCTQLHASGLKAKSAVAVDATPSRAILSHIHASDPDVVAISTHGRGLSRLLLGSVADKVLREGGRATLIVPPGVRAPEPKRLSEARDAADLLDS